MQGRLRIVLLLPFFVTGCNLAATVLPRLELTFSGHRPNRFFDLLILAAFFASSSSTLSISARLNGELVKSSDFCALRFLLSTNGAFGNGYKS